MNELDITRRRALAGGTLLAASSFLPSAPAQAATAAGGFQIYVSNERSDNVTVIDGKTFAPLATFAVGKRPRGIHASPDGKTVYVALSGTPVGDPPQLDAKGNPILTNNDDDDDVKSDKTQDGVGVISVATRKVLKKIKVGSDPEEFDLTADGKTLYVSNEDVKTGSQIDIATGKVSRIVSIAGEPEGVGLTPDGKQVYFTCETSGDIYVVDLASFKVVGHVKVDQRPRSVAFIQGGKLAVVPSESAGKLYVIDTAKIALSQTIDLPTGSRPMRLRTSLDGKKLYASTGRGGTVAVLDTTSFKLLDNIKVGDRPWGIILSPDGKYLFSANGPSNDVSVVDLAAGKEIKRVKAGSSPWGVTIVRT
ncbi:MAG: beta-propeller repeat protein [Caulobacteraceae bacterium]|nr:beta-propeller repeat protein [Caulobacteraceae bacterium]